MRLLRGIARALGVQPFGSTRHILINVHLAARRLQFDTPGSIPGHDTDIPDRWLPTMSELQDMALHINMRYGTHTTSRCLSPIRSRTPPGGRHRPHRPAVPHDTAAGKGPPHCRAPAVPPLDAPVLRPTMVNLERRAVVHAAVVLRARRTIMTAAQLVTDQPRALHRMSSHTRTVQPQVALALPPSMDSQDKRAAGRADRAHRVLRTSTHDRFQILTNIQRCHLCSILTLLQARARRCRSTYQMTLIWTTLRAVMGICTIWMTIAHPHMPYMTSWMTSVGLIRSERAALTNTDRTSVGRIIVATVIIYVTWITMQVIQRALERYLG